MSGQPFRQIPFRNPNMGPVPVWSVPLPPSVNHAYARGRNGVYKLRAVTDWETAAVLALREQGFAAPAVARYTVMVKVYFPNERRHDLDNPLKAFLDMLARVIGIDDSRVWSLLVEKAIDKQAPRLDFLVSEYTAA